MPEKQEAMGRPSDSTCDNPVFVVPEKKVPQKAKSSQQESVSHMPGTATKPGLLRTALSSGGPQDNTVGRGGGLLSHG